MSELERFLRHEDGAAAIEYALLAGLIAMVIVGMMSAVGTSLNVLYGSVVAGLATAP
ncbi:Flp family type IVb pilin [Trinickia soli]|uniref:Flp family type IVb pilin n=1 Tax=Trinickia soli TaxID=380675 RepID=UPI002AA51C1B